MSTRDDLKSFLVGNIDNQVTAITFAAGDVYAGQKPRYVRGDREARVHYLRRIPLARETGKLARHLIDIELFAAGYDETEENNLAELLEESSEQLITAYDEQVSLFRTNLSGVRVEWVRLVRGDVRLITTTVRNRSQSVKARTLTLAFQLDEWVS